MGLLGKILSAPVKIVNAPIRALESLTDDELREEDRVASKPLDILAEELEKIDEEKE